MSSPPSLVWFYLLDSSTGLPYKETTADAVSLSHGSLIAQFRDAVKSECANTLSSVDSSQLVVYKNKAAFVGKEEPLKVSSFIHGLGASKKQALVVVVPSSILSFQTQPLFFPLCRAPFFNNICNGTESDGYISFQDVFLATKLKKLYIRECYKTIASSINPGINKVLITGTAGIGKSLFLIYLLWKLVKEEKRVLLIYHPYNIYYDGKGGVFRFASSHLPLDSDDSFWNDSLWCLFDSKQKDECKLGEIPYGLCTFILSTFPRRELVNDFKKSPLPEVFYMPTWTESELEKIAPFFTNVNEWRDRFKILGGVPRYVLEDTENKATHILNDACMDCSLDDCIKKIGINSTITNNSKIIHCLVHITSIPPFTVSSVCYASPTAFKTIIRHKGILAKNRVGELLTSCQGNPLTAALCGYFFKSYAIELLEKGGCFTCRQLVHGKKRFKPEETTLDIPPSIKIVVDKIEPNQTLNQLHVPKTSNYAAFDAWIPGIGAFQITVRNNHGIKGSAKEKLALLAEANRLYWLIPSLHYNTFTNKSPHDIEQYVVSIPYPEVKDM